MTRRALALLLAGVYALSLSGSLLHRILVEHVRCADHGDLVHLAPGEHDHGPWSIDPVAPPTVKASADVVREHIDDHTHEHCAAAAFAKMAGGDGGHARLERPSPPPGDVEPGAIAAPVVVLRAEAGRFRLAPKGSPPV